MNYRCLELVNRTDARILEFRHPLDHAKSLFQRDGLANKLSGFEPRAFDHAQNRWVAETPGSPVRARGILRNLGSDDREELRQVDAHGLPRAAYRRAFRESDQCSGWVETGPSKRVKKNAQFPTRIVVEAGKSKIRYREYSVRKRRIPAALSNECILQSTRTYRLLSLGTVIFHLDIGGIARQRIRFVRSSTSARGDAGGGRRTMW